jgi:hypothetical protein
MTRDASNDELSFGYLSTWDSPEQGCMGGYLVVSRLGRPLEFHCTAPVKTSRAQQILYGPTLWPFVLGEQIGGTLLAQAKLRPDLVLVDHPAVVCLQSRLSSPMVRLLDEGQGVDGNQPDTASAGTVLAVAQYSCEFASERVADSNFIREALLQLAQYVDLAEPFERIREAMREAQRMSVAQTGEGYEHAA